MHYNTGLTKREWSGMAVLLAVVLLPKYFLCAAESVPWPELKPAARTTPLPGTATLTWDGDIADRMLRGVNQYLDDKIAESARRRTAEPVLTQPQQRDLLRARLGISREVLVEPTHLEFVDVRPAPLFTTAGVNVHQVQWRAFADVYGAGLLLQADRPIVADVIAIPDASQSPESITVPSANTNAYALKLASAGCRVLVPTLINRAEHRFKMPNREWLHRPAYELGRTLAGYEVLKIQAALTCLQAEKADRPTIVCGWGEGGRLALYTSAIDDRIDVTCVSGYFGPRERVWLEPADRTVFGLLLHFGDAEIASMIAPRRLILEQTAAPHFCFRPDQQGNPEVIHDRQPEKNGKPGVLLQHSLSEVRRELARLPKPVELVVSETPFTDETLLRLLQCCHIAVDAQSLQVNPVEQLDRAAFKVRSESRHQAQLHELERHNQAALVAASRIRADYFKALRLTNLQAFEATIEPFREDFRTQLIGAFDETLTAPNPRTRAYQQGPRTISYEVVLDVFGEDRRHCDARVFAYGILTLPSDLDLTGTERRPVVVCQHGLEGRPQYLIGELKYSSYQAFATTLAERGFITFAPQNIYIFYDRFRQLQFKANALGCTLFSIMVPQHQQITNWLASLPFVDPERIAFYGLSYGGKSAMRIPPLVPRYALSICSGDFNEWIWKNAATDAESLRYSYANKGEYEIFEFNLGNTFNYAEMATLICPRPFMVERGHFDGVAPDQWVASEYARVRHLYAAQLRIPERTAIEWFPGPHCINGVQTFDFLHHHLNWPAPPRTPPLHHDAVHENEGSLGEYPATVPKADYLK